MDIQIKKLTNKNSLHFEKICKWQQSWWDEDYKEEKVKEFMERCLNSDKIPQTYIALCNDKVVGMYQITMDDNVDIRPDYYPWLVNVYVDEEYRGKGVCSCLMKDAITKFKNLNIKRMYLYTKHENLYEKYGWKFLEEVETLKGKIRKIYYLDLE